MIDLSKCEHLVIANRPNSAAAESFRILRTNLSLRDFKKKMKVINVISASVNEGKSTTILNLAYSYAQLGKKVLIMDLDLRNPSLHKLLKVKNEGGLASYLENQTVNSDCFVEVAHNLDFLPIGAEILFGTEFIQSSNFDNILNALKKNYDMIFIDCPPINIVSDAIVISKKCDATIICITYGKNTSKELRKMKDQIEQVGINVAGVVMTKMPVENKKYGSRYYGYYENSYYDDDKKKKKVKKENND